MWVVAGVGLDKRAHGPFAGAAVGAVVGIEVMLFGAVAGAAMNPARAFGPYIAMGDFSHYWIYVAGPFVGMALLGISIQARLPSLKALPQSV